MMIRTKTQSTMNKAAIAALACMVGPHQAKTLNEIRHAPLSTECAALVGPEPCRWPLCVVDDYCNKWHSFDEAEHDFKMCVGLEQDLCIKTCAPCGCAWKGQWTDADGVVHDTKCVEENI